MSLTLRPRFGLLRTLALLGALLGATSAGAREYWVYVGTFTGAKSKGIYVSRLDERGRLSVPELAATTPKPVFLTVDRTHRFLYAANEINNFRGEKAGSVSAFAIDRHTGKLTALNQQSAVAPGPDHIDVDATGRVVLVANYDGTSVTSFPVSADGSLGPAASFVPQHGSSVNPLRQAAPHAHSINVDPGNRFALVCDLGLDQVLVFALDPAHGTITANDPPFARIAPGAGPRHLVFRPDGRFVYVVNEIACTMTVFAFDAARGALSEVQTASLLPAGEALQPTFAASEVCVHPSGRFLYGGVRGHNSVTVFQIDEPTGKISFVENVSSGGLIPRNFNLDPGGRFLLVANQDSGSVVVFRIDGKTGRLTPTGDKAEIEKPVCVVFVPVE